MYQNCLCLVIFCVYFDYVVGKKHDPKLKECGIPPKEEDYDINLVYNCPKEESCCVEGGNPSCCKSKPTDTAVKEQLTLWGGLLGFIFALSILACYCRKQIQCCDDADERTLGEKCCPCCCKPNGGDNAKPERYRKIETPLIQAAGSKIVTPSTHPVEVEVIHHEPYPSSLPQTPCTPYPMHFEEQKEVMEKQNKVLLERLEKCDIDQKY